MESQKDFNSDIKPEPPIEPRQSRLRAGPAVVIMIGFIGIQVIIGVVVGIALGVIMAMQKYDFQNPEVVDQMKQMALAPATVLGLLISGIIMITISHFWFRNELRDGRPYGGAWSLGTAKPVLFGLVSGACIAVLYLIVSSAVSDPEITMGPLTKMAMTPGAQQILWVILAIFIAPPIEELIFRGVVYGGLYRSCGPIWAVIISTGVFVMLHITEMIHFWPSVFAITGMALIALWFRLKNRAIGPAIAVHFAYNSVLAAVVIYSTS